LGWSTAEFHAFSAPLANLSSIAANACRIYKKVKWRWFTQDVKIQNMHCGLSAAFLTRSITFEIGG
jgi:hypothetical protein